MNNIPLTLIHYLDYFWKISILLGDLILIHLVLKSRNYSIHEIEPKYARREKFWGFIGVKL